MKYLLIAYVVLLVFLSFVLGGCSQTLVGDHYKPGDGVNLAVGKAEQLLQWRKQYCETADPLGRAVLLSLIRKAVPDYPEDGVCADLVEHLKAQEAADVSKQSR